jgi:hypothetical protein
MVDPAYSGLDSATAIAVALQVATTEAPKDRPYVWDISDALFALVNRGFRFKDLGLRKIPGGYYSEDVEDFVGRLLSMGYATQRSPIRLTRPGMDFCERIIQAEQDQKEVARLREELEKLEKLRQQSLLGG